MKKNVISVLMIAGLLSVILNGCQDSTGQKPAAPEEIRQQEKMQPTAKEPVPVSRYQFVKDYGIIESEYPIYMLDPGTEQELTKGDVTVHSIFAIQQNQELIVSAILDDRSNLTNTGDEGIVEGSRYHELGDGTKISSVRYQEALWEAGEGMVLTGPEILQEGYRPQDAQYQHASYVAYYDFYEAYGYMRYFIEVKFETPSALDFETYPNDYTIRVLDLESPVTLSMKRAPGYDTLEELAEEEKGSIDTHEDFTIIAMGEKADEGIDVSWYVCNSVSGQTASVVYTPPSQQKIDMPVLSNGDKTYSIKDQTLANPYIDRMGVHRLEGVNHDGRRHNRMFEVPQNEQDASFSLIIPGLTLPSDEISDPVTLEIPEDTEGLTEEISFQNGKVRILKIARMKEPQKLENQNSQENIASVSERPAVYIDVEVVSDLGEAALRGMLCQRKRGETNGWENQRYDFDGNGNLSGFRIFYDEGDTEVTLRFISPVIYWAQPFEMGLSLDD